MNNLFKEFTNMYSLVKTLRFELIPEPETKKILKKWIKEYNNENFTENNYIAMDYKKKKAYDKAKLLLDKLHEKYINMALQSDIAKSIDISKYYGLYINKSSKKYKEKDLIEEEKSLRNIIGESFCVPEQYYNKEINEVVKKKKKKDKNEETQKKKNSGDKKMLLTDSKIIKYVVAKKNELIKDNDITEEMVNSLVEFDKFFGYLDKYNENRNNYYIYNNENSASIATRIISDNLPIFCSNVELYKKEETIYKKIYSELKNADKELKIKDVNGIEDYIDSVKTNIFDVDSFKNCLSQNEINAYNDAISIWNYLINLYNQMRGNDKAFKKVLQFSKLKKQIGCGKYKNLFFALEKDKESELDDSKKNNKDILSVEKLLKIVGEKGEEYFIKKNSKLKTIINYIKNNVNYDGLYWNDKAVNIISNKYFSNWHIIKDKLKENEVWSCVSYDEKREEQIKINDAVEIKELFKILDQENKETVFKSSIYDKYKDIVNDNELVSKCLMGFIIRDINDNIDLFKCNKEKIVNLKCYKDKNIDEEEDDLNIMLIKEWFDSIIGILTILRYFNVKRNKIKGSNLNSEFYNSIDEILLAEDVEWNKWYDGIRNYLTKKELDNEKENMVRLNFDNSRISGGWSLQYSKAMFKYNNQIYLGVFKDKKIFEDSNLYSGCNAYLIRNINLAWDKNIADKGFKSFAGRSYTDIKNDNNEKELIDLLLRYIENKKVSTYPKLKELFNKKYDNLSELKKDIELLLSQITGNEYVSIEWKIIKEIELQGNMYLFRVVTKDSKDKSIGKPDLQTIYWNDVLKEDSNHRLCGGSQIFMRNPISMNPKVVHLQGTVLINKRFKNGKCVPNELIRSINKLVYNVKTIEEAKNIIINSDLFNHHSDISIEDLSIKIAKHDIVKDKRFYYDEKYLFYCPVEFNYAEKKYGKKEPQKALAIKEINDKINSNYYSQNNKFYIGIDRGERNLLYISILNKDGQLQYQEDQNIINDIDYLKKLEEKAILRDNARKSWQKIENISKLKEGYISNVVHKIVKKLIEMPSYVVLENLNSDFKQNRAKIEKSIYQKFEVALAKKLNFIVDKEINEPEIGSIKNGIQLTPPLNNYKDIEMKKQFGVMLYTRANYTSITDPVTGWRKTIYLKKDNEKNIKKQILETFTDIGFDGKDYYFKYNDRNTGKEWILYSSYNGIDLPRYQYRKTDKSINSIEKININKILNELFINFDKNISLKKQIEEDCELNRISDKKETGWMTLLFVINMIQQIRNDGVEENNKNFLYSPVRDDNGKHYDSRLCDNVKLPKDADANGAYNIARKGIIMDEHIKYCYENGIDSKKINLLVKDEEWDWWLQDRDEWRKKLPEYAVKN